MIKPFKKQRGGIDPLKASDWNRMARIVEGLSKLAVAPPLRMLRTQHGTTLLLEQGFGGGSSYFIGRIVDDGPGAPGNYTDQRYWVKEQKITNSGEADTTDLTWADATVDGALWVTATNLAEVLSETHFLLDNNNYRVLVWRSDDQTPIARYSFYSLGDVELTTTAAAEILPVIADVDVEDEAAEVDTWDRAAQPANKDGVTVVLQTRTAYDDTGDEKLYGYVREFTFDAFGKLAEISAETRYEIDEPGVCP